MIAKEEQCLDPLPCEIGQTRIEKAIHTFIEWLYQV